jgi:hypothetical protein
MRDPHRSTYPKVIFRSGKIRKEYEEKINHFSVRKTCQFSRLLYSSHTIRIT